MASACQHARVPHASSCRSLSSNRYYSCRTRLGCSNRFIPRLSTSVRRSLAAHTRQPPLKSHAARRQRLCQSLWPTSRPATSLTRAVLRTASVLPLAVSCASYCASRRMRWDACAPNGSLSSSSASTSHGRRRRLLTRRRPRSVRSAASLRPFG